MFQGENSGAHTVFVAATAATVAMHEAGSTGNTDRQQSDSRVSAEGKGTARIGKKTGRNGRSRDWRTEGKGKRGDSWRNRQTGNPLLSLQPLLVSGRQPAPPSIALREMEREERKGWGEGRRGETRDEHSEGRWRGEEVQEEDAAMTRRRTGEEGKGKGGWGWWKNSNRREGGLWVTDIVGS